MDIPRGKYIGTPQGEPPKDEAEHFYQCEECGLKYESKEIAEKCGMDYVMPMAYAEPPPPFGGAQVPRALGSASLPFAFSAFGNRLGERIRTRARGG